MQHVTGTVLGLLALTGVTARVGAQEPPGERRVTVTAGVGNSMGWLGAQGEVYFAGDRLSGFVGLGYTPDWDNNPSGLTVAGGVRGYTTGVKHRGFLEGAVLQLAVDTGSPAFPGSQRYYGPALLAGYQYTASYGFTAMLSAGVGYILEAPTNPNDSRVAGVLNIGLGYTWR